MADYRKTYQSPWHDYKDRIGRPFSVVRVINEPDDTHDEECLPMYRVRFADGFEIDAWPEEVIQGDLHPDGCAATPCPWGEHPGIYGGDAR